jgi:hypothetical protein
MFLRSKKPEDEVRYKKYKNYLTKILRDTEKRHIEQLFRSAKGKMKETWRLINKITRRSISISNETEYMDDKYTSKLVLANCFNQFFAEIGPELANEIKTVSHTFSDYLKKPKQPNYVSEASYGK